MLEGEPCVISRAMSRTCETNAKWHRMRSCIQEIAIEDKGKQPAEASSTEVGESSKRQKALESMEASSGSGGSTSFDPTLLIPLLGWDLSINCLLRCSRSDYGSVASLNRSFRNLIRSGELYKLRRMNGIVEHWIYFSCDVLVWQAHDPFRDRWISLPRMLFDECFVCSDKESLAVGTDLLVFGRGIKSQMVQKYSILTNTWSSGVMMSSPRCLFGSASLGEKAILAGGVDAAGRIVDTVELYDSETQSWERLPCLTKPRKMSSGVFMDGKFYVLGGMSTLTDVLTCGEEYDLETKVWRVIPNMSAGLSGPMGAPPLVAVVNNELFAADYGANEVKKYNKANNTWKTLGSLPEQSDSMNGWGLAFRACGNRLIVIGAPRHRRSRQIQLNVWVPRDGPPQWRPIGSKLSGHFVYNCTVMGC